MTDVPLFPASVLFLLVAGLIPALVFLSQHRPRQWKRLAAWDASGWVFLIALLYVRSIVLTVTRWPGSPPKGAVDTVFAIGVLVLLDVLLILRVASYRSFVDRDQRRETRPGRDS